MNKFTTYVKFNTHGTQSLPYSFYIRMMNVFHYSMNMIEIGFCSIRLRSNAMIKKQIYVCVEHTLMTWYM